MHDEALLGVLHHAVAAVRSALDGLDDWGQSPDGTHPGQYRSDVVADAAALEVLSGSGLGVLSEESGRHHPDRELLAVLDPVDGSTNAARGIPWYATSICVLDEDGPRAAVVANQATGECFEATRGSGARCDGVTIATSSTTTVARAVVVVSGWTPRHLGWLQYRALGAAALDLCAVAMGRVDAFVDGGVDALGPWDYLGGLLVCTEAGAVVTDAYGRDLVTTEPADRRTPFAAATPALLAELRERATWL